MKILIGFITMGWHRQAYLLLTLWLWQFPMQAQPLSDQMLVRYPANNFMEIREGAKTRYTSEKPIELIFNFRDSTLTLAGYEERLWRFLEAQTNHSIQLDTTSDATASIYMSDKGYVFSLNYQLGIILIAKKEIPLKTHSFWLENIFF